MFDLADLFTSTNEFNFAHILADPLRLSERASYGRLKFLKS